MSENKPRYPDYKSAMEGGGLSETERGAIALPLITKDKNLPTKTNIPDGFVMAVLDTFEPMSADSIADEGQNKHPNFTRLMKAFGEFYRTDMMSENGWSTENYVRVASAPLSLTDARIAETQERLKEGNKK